INMRKIAEGPVNVTFTAENLQKTYGGRLATAHIDQLKLPAACDVEMLPAFLDALLFRAGYNAALVALGAALLGIAAGSGGTFLSLRKRALVSDAVAHATLPGVGIAFIVMVALGGDGRSLPGLLLGSAVSTGIGLLMVQWIATRTRLAEDAAIGAVLSVFFG